MSGKENVALALSKLLADSYTLYLKTHNYHWNVKGKRFRELHLLFEEQYTELALAVDEIAERIRTLGFTSPGSYAAFAKMTDIKEAPNTPPNADSMVNDLAHDQAVIVTSAKAVFHAAEKIEDEATADLAIRRMQVHEKAEWMLNSIIDEKADPIL